MKKKNNTINPILETIAREKKSYHDFYNLFSIANTNEIEKGLLYNCTISYKFNNYHGENCYFNIIAFNHDTLTEIDLGTIYTKSTIIHPTIRTDFYYSEEASRDLHLFMLYLDELLNDIYFNKI